VALGNAHRQGNNAGAAGDAPKILKNQLDKFEIR